MSERSFANEVDYLLSVSKVIAGRPSWQPTNRTGQLRWGGSLESDGDSTGMKIAVDAYPNEAERRATITLSLGYSVWRVELGQLVSHFNEPPVPTGCRVGVVSGSHYHAWFDNRMLAVQNGIAKLKFARQLPANVQGIPNALRWFCPQVGIDVTFDPPEFPNRTNLV